MKAFAFIDVQKDFIDSNGALYVPNSESIKKNIIKLNDFARQTNTPICYTIDWHNNNDPEMNTVNGPFPPHCIKDTKGASFIDGLVVDGKIFEKNCYDVFDEDLGNPDITDWLTNTNITEIWIAGVAVDYCIKAAALGFRKLGIEVYIFQNAIMGVSLDTTELSIKEMKEAGCHFVNCGV